MKLEQLVESSSILGQQGPEKVMELLQHHILPGKEAWCGPRRKESADARKANTGSATSQPKRVSDLEKTPVRVPVRAIQPMAGKWSADLPEVGAWRQCVEMTRVSLYEV